MCSISRDSLRRCPVSHSGITEAAPSGGMTRYAMSRKVRSIAGVITYCLDCGVTMAKGYGTHPSQSMILIERMTCLNVAS